MAFGYVEELALRYFEKKHYLVIPNIRFQLKKRIIGRKVAGWSDIDMIALSINELLIVQCKSFIGTAKSEKIANDITNWFKYTELFLKEDSNWKKWVKGRSITKYLIVDHTVKKTEVSLKEKDIKVLYYGDLLKELINILKSGEARKGKEDDAIIRLLCAMIDKKMLNQKMFV